MKKIIILLVFLTAIYYILVYTNLAEKVWIKTSDYEKYKITNVIDGNEFLSSNLDKLSSNNISSLMKDEDINNLIWIGYQESKKLSSSELQKYASIVYSLPKTKEELVSSSINLKNSKVSSDLRVIQSMIEVEKENINWGNILKEEIANHSNSSLVWRIWKINYDTISPKLLEKFNDDNFIDNYLLAYHKEWDNGETSYQLLWTWCRNWDSSSIYIRWDKNNINKESLFYINGKYHIQWNSEDDFIISTSDDCEIVLWNTPFEEIESKTDEDWKNYFYLRVINTFFTGYKEEIKEYEKSIHWEPCPSLRSILSKIEIGMVNGEIKESSDLIKKVSKDFSSTGIDWKVWELNASKIDADITNCKDLKVAAYKKGDDIMYFQISNENETKWNYVFWMIEWNYSNLFSK